MIEQLYSTYLSSTGICTDTRSLAEGNLFIALKGPSFNANDFVLTALSNGALACVVDENREEFEGVEGIYKVDDGLKALQELALFHRSKLRIPVIGLTGSNGKTTTKELIHAALSSEYRTYATKGNLNNHIGVPLSLLEIDRNKHKIAIIEMGANHIGEIADLCKIARPNFGLITNLGLAHLEGFGSEAGIYRGKKELFDFIKEIEGKAFINADDFKVLEASEGLEQIRYGTSDSNHLVGGIEPNSVTLRVNWKKSGDEYKHNLGTQLTGEYNFTNVLAAVCIASYFGVSPEHIKEGIGNYRPDNNRSQIERTDKDNEVILDCYNANPSSMSAALTNLDHFSSEKPKVAILGDMLELGDRSAREHEIVLDQLSSIDLAQIYLVGPEFRKTKSNPGNVECFESTSELASVLAEKGIENSIILLKASRKMKLEQLFELL